ncbi:hypothetical protein POF50_019130 [Streptomyces sp. SL13]|uniref:Uncharacterized protein n=1 Tax=Streptantibioticus silvisoli TaxID=2705255 RepID=A0AA90H5M9_9ACTN|nr:hypothetical protein [Streptantibioticus silvisoli]MDI5971423.1 hypothetical protein [Streptantibioticus silvisoli]
MSIDWTSTRLAAVDDAYDRDRASNGDSRFGAYLLARLDGLREGFAFESAGEFALAVWQIATSPVMSPGYVRLCPDVDCVTTWWADDNSCTLHFDVHVRLPRTDLAAARPLLRGWKDWQLAPRDPDGSLYRARWEPEHAGNALLTTTVVHLAVTDAWDLPAPTGVARLAADAKQTVAAVATAINHQAGPAVAALRGEGPC